MAICDTHLRVDISGGTLDLWPLFNFVGGAKTINTAINLKAHCDFHSISSSNFEVSISNLNYHHNFKNVDGLLNCSDRDLDILKPVILFYKSHFKSGYKISLRSDSPVGGGLGGSSTLLVAMIKAMDQELGLQRSESQTVDLACNLESFILNTPAGTQDYFQAVQPGLSVIHYDYQKRERVFFESPWLNARQDQFKLIYSGHPHHSGLNNWRIFQKCVDKDPETISVLKDLKQISDEIYSELLTKSGSNISSLLQSELKLRRMLATGYVNEPLERIINFLVSLDVHHFKICGAGGGGCMWALIPAELNSQLKKVESLHSEIRVLETKLVL